MIDYVLILIIDLWFQETKETQYFKGRWT